MDHFKEDKILEHQLLGGSKFTYLCLLMKGKLRMFAFVRHTSYITLGKEIVLRVNISFKKLGDVFISSNQEMLV